MSPRNEQPARLALTAAADSTWDIGIATAASTFLLGNAQADKDSQIASAQVPLGGSPLAARQIYIKETADAQLTLTTSQANADQGWITSNAAADSGFLNDDAIAWDGMIHTEATAADDFAHTDDEAVQTEADDIGADEADTIMPEAQADETQSAGDATANSNFTIAQANQTAAEWSSLASSLGIPWADVQSGIAAALATWATTAASNYQAFIAKLGLAETDYATSDVTQFTNEFKKIDLADLTDANALADADQILADTLADDEMGTEQATATGDDGFWVSVGEANHDYRVAQAQAIHDALVGGPMADYTAAMTVAAADKAAALNGAITQFHVVVDPAVASQTTDDAQATFTDDKAFDDAQLDDTTQADEATDTYSDLESGDYDTEQRADNQAGHDLAISDSDGQAAAIIAYDQANPSPWADQAAASAQAQATLADAQADAELTADNASADAQEAQEISQADATEAEDIANAQSSHDSAVDQSQQTEDLASSSPISEPDPLVAPDDGTPPTLTADYVINYTAGNLTLKNSSEDFLSLPKGVPSFGENQEPGAPNMMPFWDPASIQLPWGGTMPYGLAHTFTPGNFLVVPGYSLFYTMPLADSSITTGSDYESSISPGMTVTLAGGNWANGTPSSTSSQSIVLFVGPQQSAGGSGSSGSGGNATAAAAAKGPAQGADTDPMNAQKGDSTLENNNKQQKWDPKEVADILMALDPQLGAWWTKQQYQGGYINPAPGNGQIASAGSGWTGWWYTDATVSSKGTPGHRPVTVIVPDEWSSEQVADYIRKEASGAGKLSREFFYFISGAGSMGPLDADTKRTQQQKKEIGDAALEIAGGIMKTYFEILAGTNPGGAIVMAAEDVAKGKYLAGIVGFLSVLPAEKLLALLERLPESGLVIRFASGEEATLSKKLLKEMGSLSKEEQQLFKQQLAQADTVAKARATIAEFAEKSAAAAKKSGIGKSELGNALSDLGTNSLGRNLNRLEEFGQGAGFSGVFDVESGKFLAYASGETKLASGAIPANRVAQFGGHQDVNAALSGVLKNTSNNRLGFSMVLDAEGNLAVRFNSGINSTNPNVLARTVPESMRQKILDAISKATGRKAYSAQ